ncbi:MAG: ferrous iron transport protein B [Planctomycetota bacterium]|jgi:ferrous iron transport protein B
MTLVAQRFVALIGNPNVGKSTLFNLLTGGRQRIANFPGVTVDARQGALLEADGVQVLDLPGAYSLRPAALDDAVVADLLRGDHAQAPERVIVVLDATNLRRNLYLLSEIFDLGIPVVVALNMADEARRAGLPVPCAELQETIGVPVVETVAVNGGGIDGLRAALDAKAVIPKRGWRFHNAADEERLTAAPGSTTWEKLRSLEADSEYRAREVVARYAWIGDTVADVEGAEAPVASKPNPTDRADRWLLHPVLGPVIFLIAMGLVFQSIFSWAEPLMGVLEGAFGVVQATAKSSIPGLLGSLIGDGIVAGVGSVAVFLPQIVILFLFLGLLEDSGYMARAAFIVDRPLRAVGLSGRSFIPLLSGFACAIPGVMATRTIPNRFERMLAIFVTPLMTCSARLPVYVLLIAGFVPDTEILGPLHLQGLVLLLLYLAGLFSALLIAFLVSRGRRTSGRLLPLVVELPPYRRPTARAVWLKLKVRAGDFLKRAGTVIFAVTVVLWFLAAFPRLEREPGMTDQAYGAAQTQQSYAGKLGHAIEPVIEPLGYDWKIGVGLIASFAAREVFVGTMGVVYSVGGEVDEESEGLQAALRNDRDPVTGKKVFSLATVFSLLAFFVFALQCGATVAVVYREAGSRKLALGQLFGFLALAYVSAFVTYRVFAFLGYA